MLRKHTIMSMAALLLLPASVWAVKVGSLRTEQLAEPVGIDTQTPRFSWQLSSQKQAVMQTSYRIIVASTSQKLAAGEADLWDSGVVKSSDSQWVTYKGKTLKSNAHAYWKVYSQTDKDGGEWSQQATFSVGLLNESNWKGQWIGADHIFPGESDTQWSRLAARYLRKEFSFDKKVKRATAYICGLGLYEMYINGKKVGDQVLAPAPSDYRKTVLYNSFDVTEMLEKENAVGVILGNGRFYTMRQNYKPYKIPNFGYPKMRFNMIVEFEDGSRQTIVSDATWKLTAQGPIRMNNEYDGEEYDARLELGKWSCTGYDDSAWEKAQRVSIPYGTMRPAMAQNMVVNEIIRPVSVKMQDTPSLCPRHDKDTINPFSMPKTGHKYILDMGQNMSGWIRMNIKGNAGDTIKLRFGEQLTAEGELYVLNLRDARVTDTYVISGKETEKSWAPRFTYHGFRYVEVNGYPEGATADDFVGEVVYDRMQQTGTFECSNKTLNAIYKNAVWGIKDNYKGVPLDCPQRNERQPWLGDHATGALGESFIFENSQLYAKWMDDIREAQREDGCVPDVVPAYWNYYSDNVTWPSAWLLISDMIYTQFGNDKPIRKNYQAMKHWLEHIRSEYMTDNYIVTKDRYGDWCVPPESLELIHSKDPARRTDGELIATSYYYGMLQMMKRFARIQNLEKDIAQYDELAERIKDSFNRKFLTVKENTSEVKGHILYPDSIFYGNNTVTANLLPYAFGMVPQKYQKSVEDNVIKTIIATNKGQISTGVIGSQWLMRSLCDMGRADVAYLLATNTKYPSWGYMLANGATTIWELWNGDKANPEMNSGNHVMLLGDLIPFCYQRLGGISSDNEKVGYKHIILRPEFGIQEISHADVSFISPYGKIVSRWNKTPMHLEWDVEVPVNTTAEVYLPDGKIQKIGSGKYHFSCAIPVRNKAVLADEFLYEETSFPECHGATIAETPEGDLVASFFGGTKERNPDCCIWVCRKPKGSDQWTAPVEVANGVFPSGPRKACWNPVLFQVPDGELMLFYKIGTKVSDWSGWLVRSTDNGKTWSKPEQLPEGFLGPVKNKPEWIDGKIICPSSTEGDNGWRVHFEISEDKGKTWRMVGPLKAEMSVPTQMRKSAADSQNKDDQEGGEAIKGAGEKPIYAIQPSIIKHKDGTLQVLCRTRNALLATAWSKDRGETWSDVTLSSVPSNNSGTDAVTLKDGRHLLIYNNFSTLNGTPKGPRTPLDIAVSKDGVDWKSVLRLEDSPISQYSYPSIIQGSDGMVHVIYTWRRQRIKYQKIDPKKL